MRTFASYLALLAILLTAVPAFADKGGNGNGNGNGTGNGNGSGNGNESAGSNEQAGSATESPTPSSSAASSAPVEMKRYIVVLSDTSPDSGDVAAKHALAYGAQVTGVYRSALKGYAATIPSNRVDAVRAEAQVQFVAPDTEVQVSDQAVGTGVHRIKADAKPNKGAGVNIAVIDTGIDVRHPDLAANIVGGTNCSKGGPRSYDDGNGHGTHVAGIIAALDNGMGVVGVAPAAKLWAVRVLNDQGTGWISDVVCGIDFVDSKSPARGGPIAVANMSLGGLGMDDGNCGSTFGDAMHRAICRAVADGVTFAVAAGNSARDLSNGLSVVPASYDEVITVTALADSNGQPCSGGAPTKYGDDDTFASFSNFATSAGDQAHLLAAPGVDIYSTWKGGGYETRSGTSMASPHIAGSAALYVSTHPGVSPASVRDALKAVAEPEDTNFNSECPTKGGRQLRFSHTDPSNKHPEHALRADSL